MIRALSLLRWPLFTAYVVAGALALMVSMPIGLRALSLSLDDLTFLPARILTAPWSLAPLAMGSDSVTTLAFFIIGYGFNIAMLMVVAREWEADPPRDARRGGP